MSFNIKITPRESLAPVRPAFAVRIAPKRPAPTGPALSPLAQDEASHRALSKAEAAEEVRVAYAIIAEMLPLVGLTVERTNIRVTTNRRFLGRMGDARTFSYRWEAPSGVIRLSSSPLWRRASPTKRRNTVIHELAHVLANCEAKRNVGHGRVWQNMMRKLGEEPVRCHAVDRNGLRRRGHRAPVLVNENATIFDFNVGDRVTFTARGRVVVGRIATRGPKRFGIVEDGQTKPTWRVPPVMLRRI